MRLLDARRARLLGRTVPRWPRSGIATPQHEIALIQQRQRRAEEEFSAWLASTTGSR
jgi:hypothetical protein